MRNDIARKLSEALRGISERIKTLRFFLSPNRCVTLINVYAATMTYPDEDNEIFYAQLLDVTINVPAGDRLFLF